MSTIDKETIENLIQLSRIECSPAEQEDLQKDLAKILAYIEQLQEIDTENVPPCHQVLEGDTTVWREDQIGKTLPRELFLGNAPSQVGGMIRVPPVLKSL
jgi:aspartyl-tRNA(Asn)/glutamyl-tRNA(Gln) amidotransferase subunit C